MQIFHRILHSCQPIKIATLKDAFGVSDRTIRYDLDNIDEYLRDNKYPALIRKQSEGISFAVEKDIRRKLRETVKEIDTYTYVFSQEERLVYIFCKLLGEKNYITIQYLSEYLNVSKTTLQNDIHELKCRINTQTEYVETIKSKGIRLAGKEQKLRKIASKTLFAYLGMNNQEFLKLFNDVSILQIQNFVREAEKQLQNTLSDDAFNNLVIHLAIAIKRIRMGKDIVMETAELRNLLNTPEFAIAAGIAKHLEESFNVKIPRSEIGYITIHLLGSNLFWEKDENDFYQQMIVLTLIGKVANDYGTAFEKDEALYENLLQHIHSSIYRTRRNIKINNPILQQIKQTYPRLFNCVQNAVVFLEKDWHIVFSEEECGYICIHFMTAKERMQNKKERKAKVLLVCATGIGTSKYVLMKLQSIFDFTTVATVSLHNAYEVIANNDVDLVITTVPLKSINIKCILVQPFLTEKNISELSIFFSQYVREEQKSLYIPKLDEVLAVARKYCPTVDEKLLQKDMAHLFMGKEKSYPSFIELLDKNCAILGYQGTNWRETVELGSKLLFSAGCIAKNYIKAVLNNVEKMGSYMMLYPGVIMPHAKPEDGVIKTSFSLITLKSPLVFTGNKSIKVIITLAGADAVYHSQALKELMRFFENENNIKKLLKVKSYDEISQCFEIKQ